MAGRKVEDLPCGGCPFCRRAHQQWSRFEEDVNDVVPLAVRAVSSNNSASTGVLDEPQGDQEAQRSKVDSLSKERFREEQAKDPDLELILRWLHLQQDPSPLELSLMSPASKYYWLHRTQLELKDEVVYYRWFDAVQDVWKLVVPSSLKESVSSSLHDDPLSGHLGQNNTVRLVK